jgi:hypothetical protein
LTGRYSHRRFDEESDQSGAETPRDRKNRHFVDAAQIGAPQCGLAHSAENNTREIRRVAARRLCPAMRIKILGSGVGTNGTTTAPSAGLSAPGLLVLRRTVVVAVSVNGVDALLNASPDRGKSPACPSFSAPMTVCTEPVKRWRDKWRR